MTQSDDSQHSRISNFLKELGPGLITGASDDDPSGIATYSQAGAQFGLSTLWTALLTFPLMYAIQEMCGRIGMVSKKGLITNIKNHYHPIIVIFTLLFTAPAIILNIGADLEGMGAVSNLMLPQIPATIFSIFFTILLVFAMINFSYKKIIKVLKYFCISILIYLIIPFFIKLDWTSVLRHTLIPTFEFKKDYINILVAILGTTISPYLFFWQATLEAETVKHKTNDHLSSSSKQKKMFVDVGVGMFFSNLVMYFIILSTGSILFKNGITHIDTVEQAAKALEPVAGKMCYLLFSIGVISTGFLAIPVFCGCLAYIIASTFNFEEGLDKKLREGKIFYSIIIISLLLGLLLNTVGISPIQALIGTAVLYGISAPPLIILILLIANNKKIMGTSTNGLFSNIIGIFAVILMSIAAILLLYFML